MSELVCDLKVIMSGTFIMHYLFHSCSSHYTFHFSFYRGLIVHVVYIFVLSSPALDTKRLDPGGVRSYYTMYVYGFLRSVLLSL